MSQITNTVLMVRPAKFRMNEQTAVNNYFQENLEAKQEEVAKNAIEEFDTFVQKLKMVGVEVIVVDDTETPDTPDAVFPNNWISFHENGDIGVYPMFAENRRLERREDVFSMVEARGYHINQIIDYTEAEEEEIYLEGTGSIILDRVHKIAYCALSARADEDLFIEFCEDFEYAPVIFNAYQTVDGKRMPIYHTNVMMAIAETFAVICLDTIDDKKEKKAVVKQLKESGKEVIAITEAQMHQFAGNMLQVMGNDNRPFLVMSSTAYNSLTKAQIGAIEKHCAILHTDLNTIETCGGGSARCMLAEVFLPKEV
ncbi:citrulline utilization hydrolase CtlX [Neptunitalea lumnitzerae]|uniref:Amidinotransferase n=1 Tax=Neptunitalea lumnitzerae TaxID=2965509 RepID=A0ABQ5MHH8_9FLAO|nr:arginine deiminase-related protein [Neptunitalea sp. Y10]GLB48863.1 hypothetical protein Y10_12310 [Neptunitalea sp. Y10]